MTTANRAPADQLEALIGEHPPEFRAVELRLRDLIFELAPDAREYVDMGNKLLGYASGTRMSDLLFAIIVHRAHVNLQLADGAALPDPDGIVEGTGKRIRHVKCRSVEDVERPAVRRLMEEQIAARRPGRA